MGRLPKYEEKKKERAEFIRLMQLSEEERERLGLGTQDKICKHLHIGWNTYARWNRTFRGNGGGEFFDVHGFLKEHKQEIAKSLLSLIKGQKSVKSVELALKALGELADKREVVKVEFTASDYTRIARETIDRLREQYKESGGMCPVCLRGNKGVEICQKLENGAEEKI